MNDVVKSVISGFTGTIMLLILLGLLLLGLKFVVWAFGLLI